MFRTDVPADWLMTLYFALLHGAHEHAASHNMDRMQTLRLLHSSLTDLGRFSTWFGFLSRRRERSEIESWIGRLDVRPAHAEAIFAKNLFGATPADAVRPVVSLINCFTRRATVVASGSFQAFSVTSRYASSSDSGSTSGVTDR